MQIDSKSFTFGGNNYEIPLPTIGQYLQIQANRTKYSDGQYTNWIRNGNGESIFSLDLVDAISHLIVLCPKLVDDLNIESKNVFALPIGKAKELISFYKEFAEWYVPKIEAVII